MAQNQWVMGLLMVVGFVRPSSSSVAQHRAVVVMLDVALGETLSSAASSRAGRFILPVIVASVCLCCDAGAVRDCVAAAGIIVIGRAGKGLHRRY